MESSCGSNQYQAKFLHNTEKNNDRNTETPNVTVGTSDDKTKSSTSWNKEGNKATGNEIPIEATVVGATNLTTRTTNNWGSFNFGWVQFLNLGTDIKNLNLPKECTLMNAQELLGKDVCTLIHHIMQQSGGGPIKEWWTLLDSQATVDVFCNPKIIKNIHEVPIALKILSTKGISTANKIGLLKGYGWVWYHATGIANILSLAQVKKKF